MVEFNLERWLRTGEELITRNGIKVLACHYFPENSANHKLAVILDDGRNNSYYDNGTLYNKSCNGYNLFFVNDEEPKPQPKRGDTVWVRDYDSRPWSPKIFIESFIDSDFACRCVCESYEKAFKEGKYYSFSLWSCMRTTDPALDDVLDITVKLNGKEVPLSTISEETLLKLRNGL